MSDLFDDGGLRQAGRVVSTAVSVELADDRLRAACAAVTRRAVSVHRLGRVVPLQGRGHAGRAAGRRTTHDDRIHLAG